MSRTRQPTEGAAAIAPCLCGTASTRRKAGASEGRGGGQSVNAEGGGRCSREQPEAEDRLRCDGVARDRMRLGLGQVLSRLQQWLRNLLSVLLGGADAWFGRKMTSGRLGLACKKKEVSRAIATRRPSLDAPRSPQATMGGSGYVGSRPGRWCSWHQDGPAGCASPQTQA